MGKRLFLLFIAGIIGVISSPGILMATDTVKLVSMDDSRAVETILPEPEPEPAVQIQWQPYLAKQAVSAEPQIVNYTVTIYSGDIVAHNLSYSDIYKTGMLVYGHNSWDLLGNLSSLSVGETFTITEGGSARTYRVAAKVLYDKTSDGYLNNDPYLMGDIVDTAMGHSVALMTCAGVSYGNGDASQRLVVYADAV